MSDRKRSKEWPHFSKCDADYFRCNICDTNCSSRKTSNLRKHLVQNQIFLKAEESSIFISLRSTTTTPAFSTVSAPASVCDSSSAARNMGEEMLETTQMLQYKQLDLVLYRKFVE
ncbi:hypothetical protein GOODEAATRI_007301 [Goodea atripinnis]|uniref:BED-type domain-containing protein n=1 Tax=Goodea atripinnis TaxID=208336 RepID=A0ABV0MFS8_9TELE